MVLHSGWWQRFAQPHRFTGLSVHHLYHTPFTKEMKSHCTSSCYRKQHNICRHLGVWDHISRLRRWFQNIFFCMLKSCLEGDAEEESFSQEVQTMLFIALPIWPHGSGALKLLEKAMFTGMFCVCSASQDFSEDMNNTYDKLVYALEEILCHQQQKTLLRVKSKPWHATRSQERLNA